ncbi:unnamed protein product [Boreogadus saida]
MKGKTVLYAQIPPQNQVNTFTFTVMSGYLPLCTLAFRQNREYVDREDRCEVHIQFNPLKWCLTVTSGKTWDYSKKYELNMREYIFFKTITNRTYDVTLEAEDPCVNKTQPDEVVEIDQSNPLKTSDSRDLTYPLTTNVTPIREITTVASDPIKQLTIDGTAAFAQGGTIQATTIFAKVEVTTSIMSKWDNIETMANLETLVARILTSTSKSLEETLVAQTTSRGGNKTRGVGRRSTATVEQYKPDPSGRVRVRSSDRLFRQAKANRWYKWVEFTGKQIEADSCYLCSRNRQDAVYVVNTKYNFEFCLEEWTQQELDIEVNLNKSRTEGIPYQRKYVICSMKCFMLLGSSQHSKYLGDEYAGKPWNVIMNRCLDFDVTLTQEIGEVTRPTQTNFQIEEGLECYQNDEGNKNASPEEYPINLRHEVKSQQDLRQYYQQSELLKMQNGLIISSTINKGLLTTQMIYYPPWVNS